MTALKAAVCSAAGQGARPVAEAPPQVPLRALPVELKTFEATIRPEVLFAGCVTVHAGTASIQLELPDLFVDYTVESFITAGGDWQFATAGFRAEKLEFVELNVPLFSTLHDHSRGIIYYRSKGSDASIILKRNGETVTLTTTEASDDNTSSVIFRGSSWRLLR